MLNDHKLDRTTCEGRHAFSMVDYRVAQDMGLRQFGYHPPAQGGPYPRARSLGERGFTAYSTAPDGDEALPAIVWRNLPTVRRDNEERTSPTYADERKGLAAATLFGKAGWISPPHAPLPLPGCPPACAGSSGHRPRCSGSSLRRSRWRCAPPPNPP